MQIDEVPVPEDSLIAPFAQAEGHYTDAFRLAGAEAELSYFIAAFYTTPLFRAERFVLRFAAKAPSTDAEIAALAAGQATGFAVWEVEARRAQEILLCERSGRTKSWLSVTGGDVWFGSVVVPVKRRGRLVLGPVFDSLLGAHKVYSRALLSAAARNLSRVGRRA